MFLYSKFGFRFLLSLLAFCFSCNAYSEKASTNDVEPPQFAENTAENVNKMVIQVEDDEGVKKVVLFYRPVGSSIYEHVVMSLAAAGTHQYFVRHSVLPSSNIEYYIQATDFSENVAFHGFSFSPFKKDLSQQASLSSEAEKVLVFGENQHEKKSEIDKWVWIVIRVVALAFTVNYFVD